MKQNIKIYLLLLATLLTGISVNAQQNKTFIYGKVTAKSDKLPIMGVSVIEFDADNRILNGTTTDIDGNYSLKISNGEKSRIVFSYIGYQKVTRTVGTASNINIVMEDATQSIKEVNVVARRQVSTGPVNIAERDLTFAMTRIETKDLEVLS